MNWHRPGDSLKCLVTWHRWEAPRELKTLDIQYRQCTDCGEMRRVEKELFDRLVEAIDILSKRVECWWYSRHIPVTLYLDSGNGKFQQCCRCGKSL